MPSTDDGADLVLRPPSTGDLAAVAEVLIEARAAAFPAMPPFVGSSDQVRASVRALDLADGRELWVAERDGAVVGVAELKDDWLDDVYVHPAHARTGVGSALLDCVKALRPGGFSLWCFVSNQPARAFYAAAGCVELETTDGTANDEGAPDVRVMWPGVQPLDGLRRQIDDVDAEISRLAARRVALTAAVQPLKAVPGRAGRDPAREAQIARAMARAGPGVDEAAYARVVDLLVDLGLDCYERASAEGRP